MSRGMTPAILDMVSERARDKMRCMLVLRRGQTRTTLPAVRREVQTHKQA